MQATSVIQPEVELDQTLGGKIQKSFETVSLSIGHLGLSKEEVIIYINRIFRINRISR